MRQRLTYLLPSGTSVDPADIKVDEDSFQYARADEAAHETHITLALDELPQDLQVFLQDFHELHIRIASRKNQQLVSPFLSRLPPGLHAFFTPRNPDTDTRLCDVLKLLLGEDTKCANTSSSYSKPPILSERFASSSTYQFYSPRHIFDTGRVQLKEFNGRYPLQSPVQTAFYSIYWPAIGHVANFDIDFDAITQTITITVLWPVGSGRFGGPLYKKEEPVGRLEVGVLSPEESRESEELTLGGFLTVIGEDDHPSATLFSFPSRHHPLPAGDDTTYSIDFQKPTGLHPKLAITLARRSLRAPKDTCALHAYWTIPSSLFIDRYQLSDPLFLQSQNLISCRAISGEQDLEAPDWAVSGWGSAALFELATPNNTGTDDPWVVTIPTHLRYLNQTGPNAGHAEVAIPWPLVFWACAAEDGLKMSTNPFDRVNLGYDGLFGPKTMFYHVPPRASDKTLEDNELFPPKPMDLHTHPRATEDVNEASLQVPVLDSEWDTWVPLGTIVAVLLGFGWICGQMLRRGKKSASDEAKKSI